MIAMVHLKLKNLLDQLTAAEMLRTGQNRLKKYQRTVLLRIEGHSGHEKPRELFCTSVLADATRTVLHTRTCRTDELAARTS